MCMNDIEIHQFEMLFQETIEVLKEKNPDQSFQQLRKVAERCLVGMTSIYQEKSHKAN